MRTTRRTHSDFTSQEMLDTSVIFNEEQRLATVACIKKHAKDEEDAAFLMDVVGVSGE